MKFKKSTKGTRYICGHLAAIIKTPLMDNAFPLAAVGGGVFLGDLINSGNGEEFEVITGCHLKCQRWCRDRAHALNNLSYRVAFQCKHITG